MNNSQVKPQTVKTFSYLHGVTHTYSGQFLRRKRRRYKKADLLLIRTLPSQVSCWVKTCRRLQNRPTSAKLSAAVNDVFYSLSGDAAVLARRLKNARDFLFDTGYDEVYLYVMVREAGLVW